MERNSEKKRYPYLWAVLYGVFLTCYAVFALLDAFVIPRDIVYLENETGGSPGGAAGREPENVRQDGTTESEGSEPSSTEESETLNRNEQEKPAETIVTDTSYQDANISITITTQRQYDTEIYIADVRIKGVSFLKAGLAGGAFGRNVSATTSAMAEENNAILAINGDYYGFRDQGLVMRNGYFYRETARPDGEALAVYPDGRTEIFRESEADIQALSQNAVQIFSFGPGLVGDGEILVNEYSEVEQAMRSNPRTAIGEIAPLHYILLVSDGRTEESEGLSLWELAQVMQGLGCQNAYNLDGGGSSAMWFLGRVVNHPTNGWRSGERSVSDIVYIGE